MCVCIYLVHVTLMNRYMLYILKQTMPICCGLRCSICKILHVLIDYHE